MPDQPGSEVLHENKLGKLAVVFLQVLVPHYGLVQQLSGIGPKM